MRVKMNRTRYECKKHGCTNEVLSKPADSTTVDTTDGRQRGTSGPGSPSRFHHRQGHTPNPQQGAAQVSSFCRIHTCTLFMSPEGCTRKKSRSDSVCDDHMTCSEKNCNQPRVQQLNSNPQSAEASTYVRLDVCVNHKCTAYQCSKRRVSPTNFCQDHLCQANGCVNQRPDDMACCESHRCQFRGCRNPTNGDYPYCGHHIRCEMRNCGGQKHQDRKTKEYLAYCTQHVTCSTASCEKLKIERSAFCEDHTCRERECAKSTDSKPYCNDHCCADDTCTSPRPWSKNPKHRGRFCLLHTCRKERCKEYVDKLSIFCQSHGCSKPRCREGILEEKMCLEHLKTHYTSLGRRRHSHQRSGRLTPSSSRVGDKNTDSFSEEEENEANPHRQIEHNPVRFGLTSKPSLAKIKGEKHNMPKQLTGNAAGGISDDEVSDLISSSSSSNSDNDTPSSKHSSGNGPKSVGARHPPPFTQISHSQSLPGLIRGSPPPFPPTSGPGNPPPPPQFRSGAGGNPGFVMINAGMNAAGNNGGQMPGGPPQGAPFPMPIRRMPGGGPGGPPGPGGPVGPGDHGNW